MKTFIFDLDDTLADTYSTRDGVSKPMAEKMMDMVKAAPLPLMDVALALAAQGNRIIILTARTASPLTPAQVEGYGLHGAEYLYRAEGDHRADHYVKADHVEALLNDGVEVAMAWDDKAKNIMMFRSHGIPAEQV